MNPELSSYIRFYQVLAELESSQEITHKQKQKLKSALNFKETRLLSLVAENMGILLLV